MVKVGSSQIARTLKRLRRRNPKHAPAQHDAGLATEVLIWESELRAIAAEARLWNIETGGDLFGMSTGLPRISLATIAGQNATRDETHFRLDVAYVRRIADELADDWHLRYLGDWHSHHRLGLRKPSSGDVRRIL